MSLFVSIGIHRVRSAHVVSSDANEGVSAAHHRADGAAEDQPRSGGTDDVTRFAVWSGDRADFDPLRQSFPKSALKSKDPPTGNVSSVPVGSQLTGSWM